MNTGNQTDTRPVSGSNLPPKKTHPSSLAPQTPAPKKDTFSRFLSSLEVVFRKLAVAANPLGHGHFLAGAAQGGMQGGKGAG